MRLKPIVQAKAKENQLSTLKQNSATVNQKSDKRGISTDKQLAKIAGVSHDTIYKVEVIEKEATEEQKQSLSKGEKKVNTVYRELRPVKFKL